MRDLAAYLESRQRQEILCCSLRLAFLGVGIVPSRESNDKVRDVEHDAFEPMTLTILGCKLVTNAMLKGNSSKLT